jgi:nucleotide-binding universal stress UspA family protein
MLRTLLIHIAGDDTDAGRLSAGAQIARRAGAKMTAIFVDARPDMPVAVLGRGASAAYLGAAAEAADHAAATSRAHLDGLEVTWDREEGEAHEVLTRRGRTVDLLVTGPTEADLVLATGGPVLVVPKVPRTTLGKRVAVAWDGSAQAARAVRDSLPILRDAEQVSVISIGTQPSTGNLLNALLPWLERHEIDAVPHRREAREPGAAILRVAEEDGSDLLVMGAYGRPPWGEAIFGGVTRFILERAPIPLFLAH